MRVLAIFIYTLLASAGSSLAQDWRGLEPLRSTCEDVKRVLGVAKCDFPSSTFRLGDEIVTVSFATCPCAITCYSQGRGWNVPLGTVTSISRELSKPLPINNFDIDESWEEFETDMIAHIMYDNVEKGISLSAIDNRVVRVTHYPSIKKYRNLLCPKCSIKRPANADTDASRSKWSDAYGDLSWDEERKRLDTLAAALRQGPHDAKAYIVAYSDCRSQSAEIRKQMARAEAYLVDSHAISDTRIVTIYGGQREEVLTELHIRERKDPPPLTFSSTYPRPQRFQK